MYVRALDKDSCLIFKALLLYLKENKYSVSGERGGEQQKGDGDEATTRPMRCSASLLRHKDLAGAAEKPKGTQDVPGCVLAVLPPC